MSHAYDTYNYPKYWDNRDYEHESELVALRAFFSQISKVNRLIDIGAGFGRLALFYKTYASKITLAEPSKNLLDTAKKNLKGEDDISFIHTTIENLAGKVDRKYDASVLVRVMHHLEDPQMAIETVSNVLTKDGYFILEFANKLHGKALFKNILSGNFTFPLEIFSIDKRSEKNKRRETIQFLNHHPDLIKKCLADNNFEITSIRSVSNLRSPFIKKYVPLGVLLWLEKRLQVPLGKINFGPSLFILARKT